VFYELTAQLEATPVDLPKALPFTRLKTSPGEEVLWYGYNPTFHRFLNYGLVVTRDAIYFSRRGWWRIVRWTRISLDEVVEVEAIDNHARPGLTISGTAGTITFHTPFDFHDDEMNFDRAVLEKAAAAIRAAQAAIAPPN
jgi:hypothetical protein